VIYVASICDYHDDYPTYTTILSQLQMMTDSDDEEEKTDQWGYTQLNLRIKPDQKKRWQQAVEDDPRFNDLSSYIRFAVEEQIDRDQRD